MNEKQIWIIGILFMAGMLLISILGMLYPKYEIVFSVLLALWGAVAGFMANAWFSEKSKKQELGNYSKAGYRLSVDIYDNLTKTLILIDKYEKGGNIKPEHLETVAEKLKTIQSITISSNDHWRDSLPENMLLQLEARKQVFENQYSPLPGVIINEQTEEI